METTEEVDEDEDYWKGLNRTMQYGNVELAVSFSGTRCGLNRTMQYGNFPVTFVLSLFAIV